MNLADGERAVLAAFVKNEEDDAEGAWTYFHPSIMQAGQKAGLREGEVDAACRALRRKKLLAGQGGGRFASYYPTDRGREEAAKA